MFAEVEEPRNNAQRAPEKYGPPKAATKIGERAVKRAKPEPPSPNARNWQNLPTVILPPSQEARCPNFLRKKLQLAITVLCFVRPAFQLPEAGWRILISGKA